MIDKIDVEIDDIFMAKSIINKIRRDFLNDFEEFVLNSFKRENIKRLDLGLLNKIESNDDLSIDFSNRPYVINIDDKNDKEIIGEFGGIFNEINHKIAYYTLNISNSYAYEFYKRLGFEKLILSTELSSQMIYDLIAEYKKRNGVLIKPYVLINGKRTLMYLRRNPFVKYHINDKYMLCDKINIFNLKIHDDYLEIIESKPFINQDIDMTKVNKFVIVENE